MTETTSHYLDDESSEWTTVRLPLSLKTELIELADKHSVTFERMLSEVLKAGLGRPTRFGLPEEDC